MALGVETYLPDNARLDLATVEILGFADTNANDGITHTVPGRFYDIPLAVIWRQVGTAPFSARQPEVTFRNQDNNVIMRMPAPNPVLDNDDWTNFWTVDASTAYAGTVTPAGRSQVTLLPTMVLHPGYRLRAGNQNLQGNDQMTRIFVTMLRVPTGPTQESAGKTALTRMREILGLQSD